MKKMIMAVAIVCAAALAQAATVGWNVATGSATYANDQYMVFVIGQKDVTSVDQMVALLNDGADVSGYAFGSGNLNANGLGSVLGNASGKTLDAGTYTAFVAIFDSAAPVAGESNYALITGATGLTKSVGSSTASISFATGAQGTFLGNSSNWQSFGSAGPIAPEPTSGLLLLLGMAGLALKRKHA